MRVKPTSNGAPCANTHASRQGLKSKIERAIPAALANFDALPDSANVRQPVVEALFGISPTTVWRRSKTGLLPQPIRLGGTTVWNVGALREVLRGA